MADRHSDRLGVPPPAQDDEQPQVLSVATPQGGRRAFFRALSTTTFNATWIRALSGLSPGTTYFYQAIAQNTGSAAQGEILSFTTPNASGGATVMCTCNTVCTCNANGCACNAQGGSTCTCNPQGGGGGGGGHYWYPN
jgi:hypothetical protein